MRLCTTQVPGSRKSTPSRLPRKKGCIVYDKLWVKEGTETWTGSGTVRTRDRLVYIQMKTKHQMIWNLGGSGGGG